MGSHSIARLVERGEEVAGAIEATVMLACGCTVSRSIAADRFLTRPDGSALVVGKIPCPQGHPVGHRSSTPTGS